MERSIPVRPWAQSALVLTLLCLAPRSDAQHSADRVVLVASVASTIESLDAVDLRRLFLGIPVLRGAVSYHALRNGSDERLRQIFLQNLVSMSESNYERRLLALALEQGRASPPVYADQGRLLAAVAADPGAISYAWESAVLRDGRYKILRVIWEN